MDTKLKGNIAETAVLAELVKMGYGVSLPFGDNLPYDLIVDIDGSLIKIQVKYAYVSSTGALHCAGSRRTLTNRTVTKYKSYTEKEFDFVIAHGPNSDGFYIIPIKTFINIKTSGFVLKVAGKQREAKHNPEQYKNNWELLKIHARRSSDPQDSLSMVRVERNHPSQLLNTPLN